MSTPVVTEEAFARYLAHVLPAAREVEAANARRIVGGASRVTYSVDACWREGDEARECGFIVRLDPGASLLESNRRAEYAAYRGMAGSGVPVPEALWIEDDPAWFGGPFFVTRRIDGCETEPRALFAEPYEAVARRIGERLFAIGGRIAAFDWRAAGWDFLDPPEPEDCWSRELAHWERVVEQHRVDAQPIVRVAIDWLRRHPPAPAQRVAVVHGDYRTGNVLYDRAGDIHGVLDWEMCHLGDPLEDLAWTCMSNWRWGRDHLAGGVLEFEEAHRVWEQASGLRVEPEAYHWWSVFAHVKAQGIWLTGARNFADGTAEATNLPGIAIRLGPAEDRALLELLGWV